MELLGATATHVGNVRDTNQDRGHFGGYVAVVADGMGGHQGGETAASIAIAEFLDSPGPMGLAGLAELVEDANRAVFERAADPDLRGMGTTLVAMSLRPAEGKVSVVNVGDSRAYVLQGRELGRLTNDHSLVEDLVRQKRLTPEEALHHPQRNILTRALGISSSVEVDKFLTPTRIGDRFLLCSDGLFNEVSEENIADLLLEFTSPKEAAEALVAAALAGAARDNITVVVVDVVEDGQGGCLTPPVTDTVLLVGGAPSHPPITERLPVTPGPGRDPATPKPVPGLDGDPDPRPTGGRAPGVALLDGAPGSAGSAGSTGSTDLVGLEAAAATRTLGAAHTVDDLAAASPRRRRMVGLVVAGVVLGAVLAGGLLGFRWYNQSIWFVETIDDGQVAIFNGRPGGLWLIDPVRLDHDGPQLDELISEDQEQVATRPTFRSQADAEAFVEGLTAQAEILEPASETLGDVESRPSTTPLPTIPPTSTTSNPGDVTATSEAGPAPATTAGN